MLTFHEAFAKEMENPAFKAEWDALNAELQEHDLDDTRRWEIFLQGLRSFTDDFNVEGRFPTGADTNE